MVFSKGTMVKDQGTTTTITKRKKKKTKQTNKKKTEIKNPAEDERKGLVYRTQKPIYTSGQL